MNAASLQEIFKRAQSWPIADQIELAQVATFIETRNAPDFQLDDEDWKIIDARVKLAKIEGLASEDEVAKTFGRTFAK